MNNVSPEQSQGQADQPGAENQLRWRRGRAGRGERTEASWIGGAVLVVAGILFMAQNLGAFYLRNWWALFILLPAVGAFGAAWRAYQAADGRLNYAARGSLLGGCVLVGVAAIFLLDLNWTILGPVLLILAGVGMLLNFAMPPK